MKAMKATMAPKAMKTMMKAPKSMKTMKEATAKGKSKKATDVDSYFDYRESVQDKSKKAKDELLTKVLERNDEYCFKAKNARVTFFYGSEPCTKTADELKMIAATLLGPLQMAASASNARRVWAHQWQRWAQDNYQFGEWLCE